MENNKKLLSLNYKFKSGIFRDKTVCAVCEINPNYILHLHTCSYINIYFNAETLRKAQLWQSFLK